ncbi:MAG: hypothetical protein JNK82_44915 [Myxococcaceae bacterium]|nr:hypothetical protein [Myxococcaceae bacterium]
MLARVLVMTALLAGEDEPQLPKNVIVADVGLHVVGLGYQRNLTPQLAVQLTASLYVPWTQSAVGVESTQVAGLIGRLRLFVYPQAQAPRGFWLSPFVQAGAANETRDGAVQRGVVWAAGASAGWAWLPWNRLHLALGFGVQYHWAKFPAGPGFGRFWPQIDGSVGFAL